MTIFPIFGTNCSPSTRVSGITDIEARLVLVYVSVDMCTYMQLGNMLDVIYFPSLGMGSPRKGRAPVHLMGRHM